MSVLQLLGHLYRSAIQFTGKEGELTYDKSNRDLLLHDDSTPGGKRFLNMSNADERYQAKSTELDGLTGFEPQQKGFLVRLGPQTYRIRTLTVESGNITLTNPQGYAGNPKFSLAATITTDHTVTGEFTFESELQAEGGVRGNVTGNLAGNSVGHHTGDVTGDTTGEHTGSIDVRGATLLLDDGQIPLEYLDDASVGAYIRYWGVPPGTIVLWSGSTASIPENWALCNGSNGTPDLRNRFIVGAGSGYVVGDTGGANTLNPTITISESGEHTHDLSGETALASTGITAGMNRRNQDWDPGSGAHEVDAITINDPQHKHTMSGTTESDGAHTHTATTTLDNRPPYYALCYIMKLEVE